MRRFGPWLLALLILVPIVEITILIAIGRQIGPGWTLLLMLGTSVLGAWLLRKQGGRAWRAFQADVAAGRPPGRAAIDGVLIVFGGIFMLVPGFASDVIGLLLILPPTRALFRGVAMGALVRRVSAQANTGLFGARRVRAEAGRPGSAGTTADPAPPTRTTSAIEGEIIDRRER